MSHLSFAVLGARAEPYAAVPTVVLRLAVEAEGRPVDALMLRTQVQIEPRRRHYSDGEERRLYDLFGEPDRWGDTLTSLFWAQLSTAMPGFRGQTELDLPLACTYDFEVASAKYFHGLEDGAVPLLLLFSGTIFRGGAGGLSVEQVPWDREARFELPVATWRSAMHAHFGDTAWIRVRRDTFDALHDFRGRAALPTWEATIERLLHAATEGERR